MMKSKIFDEYLDLARNSYEYNNYPFPYNEDCFCSEYCCCLTDLDTEDIGRLGLEFDNGATKGCILSDLEDRYVLKVPFHSAYSYDEDIEIEFNNAYVVNWVTGELISSNTNDDYCFIEKYMSDTFIEAGLGDCICKVELYGDIDGHPIYIQEKATEQASCHSSSHSYEECKEFVESMKSSYNKEKYYSTFEDEWAIDFIEYHGEDKYIKMIDILAASGINDLHYGNYGYIDDKPVLIDYSGYRENI